MAQDPYVHGYDPAEAARLRDQADTLADLLHHDTAYPPGASVLEIGCGVGAQTVPLARNSPGAAITAVDIAASSLAAADARVRDAGLTNVRFVEADMRDLPFEAASFDHVFVCFFIEHLADPVAALRRLRGLLVPGGSVTVIEGDHGPIVFHPENEAARRAIACQSALQQRAGGDPFIGRRLYPLLTEAGFVGVRAAPRQIYVDGARPDLADSFTLRTFTAMIAGVREAALAAGLTGADDFDEGIRALRRTAEPDGTFCYTFFKAIGTA